MLVDRRDRPCPRASRLCGRCNLGRVGKTRPSGVWLALCEASPQQRVAILSGGFRGWEAQGLPVKPHSDESCADADEVAMQLGTQFVQVVHAHPGFTTLQARPSHCQRCLASLWGSAPALIADLDPRQGAHRRCPARSSERLPCSPGVRGAEQEGPSERAEGRWLAWAPMPGPLP